MPVETETIKFITSKRGECVVKTTSIGEQVLVSSSDCPYTPALILTHTQLADLYYAIDEYLKEYNQ